MIGDALASLRLAVVLLSMLIFLVFAGTIAQVEHGIWYVVRDGYFRVWWAWIEFQAFADFYNAFRAAENHLDYVSSAGFWFPGGYLIGTAMAINLLTAHTLRFKVTASGTRLLAGLATTALGTLALGWVTLSWLDETQVGTLAESTTYWLWFAIKAATVAVAAGGAIWLALRWGKLRTGDWLVLAAANLLLSIVAGGLAVGDWTIPPEAMRIVWMLAQAAVAGGVVLGGCWLVFHRRAGVVLLHAGVLVLMAHEFYTGMAADESQMRITEGQSSNFSVDSRNAELVIVDRSGNETDKHMVVDDTLLASAAKSGNVISSPLLPVDIRVIDYFANSSITPLKRQTPATVGVGKSIAAAAEPKATGSSGIDLDLPSAYVELLDKESGQSLGTYLVSTSFDDWIAVPGARLAEFNLQPVDVRGKQYEVGLRLRRIYRPFELKLIDFEFTRYAGTETPKSYKSIVEINDPALASRTATIWMNNPLRYRGETFYQQSFEKTEKTTILQVAKNEGYMLPYISCMLVLLGMVWHFGIALTKFLQRRVNAQVAYDADHSTPATGWTQYIAPAVASLATIGVFAYAMVPLADNEGEMHIEAFGELPVLDSGRVKPFDTLARVSLQYLTARQEAPTQVPSDSDDSEGAAGKGTAGEKITATRWLLDLMAGKPAAADYPVFRIENLEVLEDLKLEPRPGFFRYSYLEIEKHIADLRDSAEAAYQKREAGEDLTTYEKKLIEVWEKRGHFVDLGNSFSTPTIEGGADAMQQVQRAIGLADHLRKVGAPQPVVPTAAGEPWETYFAAKLIEPISQMRNLPVNKATQAMQNLIASYADDDVAGFNAAVAKLKQHAYDYEQSLNDPSNAEVVAELKVSEQLRMNIVGLEKWLNGATLFYVAAVMYLVAFLFACLSWLGWHRTLSQIALGIICTTLLFHTFAIWQRVIISGRPPITNLYDTTICIGWACVLLGVVFEVIYRLGIGSFVAASVGFCTLLVGHFLSQDGDTFTVLQAVLDTNFWLATHVTTINLGYATTVMAGAFGIARVIFHQILGLLDRQQEQQLSRMIYGTVCFAILFSFVGTVLGGLWADDSWGRFWGWDPKENGALLVVLWNAVVLHARWGGLAGHRGIALLAIGGNIITSWSWFGTNGLGIGLHAYGFREGTAFNLMMFWIANLVVIAIALLPWDDIRGRRLTGSALDG